MKDHQASFLASHGSPEQLHGIIDSNPGVYFPGMEENSSYNASHLRKEIQDHISPRGPMASLHSPSLNKYTHTKEDVDSLLKIQKYQLAQTSPHFDQTHFKQMLNGAHHQISAHTLKTIPFDDEMHRRFFVDNEADWGSPKYSGISDRKLNALAQNKSINQEAFQKIFDLNDDFHLGDLIDAHPGKVKKEHIMSILSSGRHDSNAHFALSRQGLI